MSGLRPIVDLDTHEVTNQPPPFEDMALFATDRAFAWGVEANRHPPELDTHDRYGRRIDEVRFHPVYHRLMALGLDAGLA